MAERILSERKPDPKKYARLQIAHTTRDSASAASAAFVKAVQSARDKYKIADVLIITAAPVVDRPEEKVVAIVHCGNQQNHGILAAQALGHHRNEIKAMLKRMSDSAGELLGQLEYLDEIASGDVMEEAPSEEGPAEAAGVTHP